MNMPRLVASAKAVGSGVVFPDSDQVGPKISISLVDHTGVECSVVRVVAHTVVRDGRHVG